MEGQRWGRLLRESGPGVQGEGLFPSRKQQCHQRKGCLLPAGVVGLNLWPRQPHGLYLLPPGAPFIELLPVKEGAQEEAASPVLLAEAQKGKEYELVLTTHTGLTR